MIFSPSTFPSNPVSGSGRWRESWECGRQCVSDRTAWFYLIIWRLWVGFPRQGQGRGQSPICRLPVLLSSSGRGLACSFSSFIDLPCQRHVLRSMSSSVAGGGQDRRIKQAQEIDSHLGQGPPTSGRWKSPRCQLPLPALEWSLSPAPQRHLLPFPQSTFSPETGSCQVSVLCSMTWSPIPMFIPQ